MKRTGYKLLPFNIACTHFLLFWFKRYNSKITKDTNNCVNSKRKKEMIMGILYV